MYMRGETEVVMGDILAGDDALRNAVRVATKANAFKGYDETLSAKSVATQMVKSTKALKADAVDIYYLHNPDPKVPILETLRAVDELHKAGKFNELGALAARRLADGSRRRRERVGDIPWGRVAATPRPRRG